MKKLLLSLALVGMLLSFSPVVHAETIQPTQQELTQQLIVLLTQMIAQLQQQINDILAQQAVANNTIAQQSQTITQIQQNTQQIAQNTTPIPKPEPVPMLPKMEVTDITGHSVAVNECFKFGAVASDCGTVSMSVKGEPAWDGNFGIVIGGNPWLQAGYCPDKAGEKTITFTCTEGLTQTMTLNVLPIK